MNTQPLNFAPLAKPGQTDLFGISDRTTNAIAITDEVHSRLMLGAAVAVGVSGGKDSQACAIAVARYLDEIGHDGPRILIHADLGMVEWEDSLPTCQRLAAHIGWELVVVKRAAGGMIERWESRWTNNVRRYQDLSCVKLILPWSTPGMRFCTSELKSQVISAKLRSLYPDRDIISVTGIRREESSSRSKMPVSKLNPRFVRPTKKATKTRSARVATTGYDWNPIIDFKIDTVFSEIAAEGLALHEGYTKYGMSRISCAFCIMSNLSDLINSARCEANQPAYRRMVELEITSTYAFQGNRWLADIAPHLLSEQTLARVAEAKQKALQREAFEAEIPNHLLYEKGWPTVMPTEAEAELIASVRQRIANLLQLDGVKVTSAAEVQSRYAALMKEMPLAMA